MMTNFFKVSEGFLQNGNVTHFLSATKFLILQDKCGTIYILN
jgi:hypothetical protein